MVSLVLTLAALVPHVAPAPARVTTPAAAQRALADALATADSVDWILADTNTVTFAIDRDGEAYLVVATVAPQPTGRLVHDKVARSQAGRVLAVQIDDIGIGARGGNLSWLSAAMKDTSAVTRLIVGADGVVTLIGNDGGVYRALPGKGSNHVVEARWAAQWDHT